jgi:DNA repair exonuclease SbcCD ATPase subunit
MERLASEKDSQIQALSDELERVRLSHLRVAEERVAALTAERDELRKQAEELSLRLELAQVSQEKASLAAENRSLRSLEATVAALEARVADLEAQRTDQAAVGQHVGNKSCAPSKNGLAAKLRSRFGLGQC